MNYQKIYNQLIERGRRTLIHGYREYHHIVPRCLGGSNDESNMVWLTAEEHYVAHQLLVKLYPDNKKLLFAATQMTRDRHGNRVNNKLYGWLKVRHAENQTGEKNHMFGKTLSPEDRARRASPGEKNGMFGKTHTPEALAKMSKVHKGKKRSAEEIEKWTKAVTGKTRTDETKAKMAAARKAWWDKKRNG